VARILAFLARAVARLANIPASIQRAIRTVEFGLALTCAGVAYAVGPDMSLTIPWLLAGWIFAAVGFLTAPSMTFRTRGVWTALALCIFAGEGIFLHVHFTQDTKEDLRVSFEFKGTSPTELQISYILRNFGKQSALVNGVALFDMQGTYQFDDPTKYVELCDTVPLMTLMFQQMTHNFLRFSEAPGITGALLYPTKVEVENLSQMPKSPVEIESGRTRTIWATFELMKPEKDFDTRIFCPIVDSRDALNVVGTAICEGASTSWKLTPNLTMSTFNNFPNVQSRILPHAEKLPTCPVFQR
jgi:hypothetical protein